MMNRHSWNRDRGVAGKIARNSTAARKAANAGCGLGAWAQIGLEGGADAAAGPAHAHIEETFALGRAVCAMGHISLGERGGECGGRGTRHSCRVAGARGIHREDDWVLHQGTEVAGFGRNKPQIIHQLALVRGELIGWNARLQVDREFIEDNFNLYGLRALVPHYNEALDMILDIERMDEAFSDDRQVGASHNSTMHTVPPSPTHPTRHLPKASITTTTTTTCPALHLIALAALQPPCKDAK